MRTITIVTGNKHKLEEWWRLIPKTIKLESVSFDLDEIQSLDLETVALDKAKRAYEQVKKPVVVEDIAAGLDKLNGLPGPFVKFFQERLGKEALLILAGKEGESATATCIVAYYDGTNGFTVRGEVKGKIVSARGEKGFGFDFGFIPDGQTQTYAEMGGVNKDKVSHRSRAIKAFVEKLEAL